MEPDGMWDILTASDEKPKVLLVDMTGASPRLSKNE